MPAHSCQGCGARGTLLHYWCSASFTATLESSKVFLRKLGRDLTPDPITSLLNIYPKDSSSHHKDSFSTMFGSASFKIARHWKQPQCRKYGTFT